MTPLDKTIEFEQVVVGMFGLCNEFIGKQEDIDVTAVKAVVNFFIHVLTDSGLIQKEEPLDAVDVANAISQGSKYIGRVIENYENIFNVDDYSLLFKYTNITFKFKFVKSHLEDYLTTILHNIFESAPYDENNLVIDDNVVINYIESLYNEPFGFLKN
nr:hypothetical protein [Abalone asfa-like virus]